MEDIIHLSRLDEGGVGLQRESVDLLQLAQKVEERIEPLAKQSQVDIKVEGASFKVQGVSAVLEEMLYNLCDNAVKYNRPGGSVRVTVTPRDQGAW